MCADGGPPAGGLADGSEGDVVIGVAEAEATVGSGGLPSAEAALRAVGLEVGSNLDVARPRSQTKSATWDPSRTMITELITICRGLRDSGEPIFPVDHARVGARAYFV